MSPAGRTDCRHYRGEKPCQAGTECEHCPQFEPLGTRVLVVKFGAMGDALRTTPILRAIHRRLAPAHVTWITDDASHELLAGNPLIHRLRRFDLESWSLLFVECFDLLLSFDKVPAALACAGAARAARKLGFAPSPEGNLTVFNPESEYALRLGLSDPLKFRQNQKSYMQIIFEMALWPFEGEEYVFELAPEDRRWAVEQGERLGLAAGDRVVGLNTGCGRVFATKKWTLEGYAELARELSRRHGCRILLLGGPDEIERNREIARRLPGIALDTGGPHPIRRFAALLELADLVVTGDTVAMHLAIALQVPVAAIFGSTCAQEIDLYGRGEKIVTDFACAPCYRKECPQPVSCMQALPVERVLAVCERLLGSA